MSTTTNSSIPQESTESQTENIKPWHTKEWADVRRAGMKKYWEIRRQKSQEKYGHQEVGKYNPHANFNFIRDWKIDTNTGQVLQYTDYLQPEFLIHRYGGSMILRESDLLHGGKSLAQDCSVPRRDKNGRLIETVELKEAA